ncbi:hypothetical protein PHLGIDRAFT_497388, partial [Phlebiopsis gigantea 11061_1 CR5-6]
RCFPHVINLCVKAALDELPQVENLISLLREAGTLSDADLPYIEILRDDPVKCTREFVGNARKSILRREDLQDAITEANMKSLFGEGVEVNPESALLRDMDVRWSSSFLMVDRFLELAPALDILVSCERHAELSTSLLAKQGRDVLADIREYLYIPFTLQETLAAELTPTVSLVFPSYWEFSDLLGLAQKKFRLLSHAVNATSKKLDHYLSLMRRNKVCAIATSKNLSYFIVCCYADSVHQFSTPLSSSSGCRCIVQKASSRQQNADCVKQ